MADEGQGVRATAPPAPAKGEDVLPWATALMRWLRREMPSFGSGLTTEYGPGRMVRAGSSSSAPHPFKIVPVVSAGETQSVLSVKILPGSVYTGLWIDDAGTAQKGETTPTIDGDPITDDPPPTLSGFPDSFTIWLQVTNEAKDVWESTTFFVQDNADDDPENDFYNGYRKVGEGTVTESGGVYSLSITRPQTLIANINHDKANFTHYWWS